jgi:hypothetical protein
VRSLVVAYYWLIRHLIKQQPELKSRLTRCRHCRILFFTHPRNKGRKDIGCPFGCRESGRREKSTQRSVDFYRSKDGRKKKIELNQRRNKKKGWHVSTNPMPVVMEVEPDRTLLLHIRMVISLIEGYRVDLETITALVVKFLRQHSMDLKVNMIYSSHVPP